MLSDFFMYSRECFLKILGVSKSRALQTLCCDRDISLLFFKLRSHNYSSSPHFFVRSSRNINCIHCGIYWLFQRTCNCSCTFSELVCSSILFGTRNAASSYDPARAARWLSYDWMPVTARAARWLRSKSHPAREGPLKGFLFAWRDNFRRGAMPMVSFVLPFLKNYDLDLTGIFDADKADIWPTWRPSLISTPLSW